ncbi:hypothetical protein P9112_000869 [Eukaryota sp. TZLM1-RC]
MVFVGFRSLTHIMNSGVSPTVQFFNFKGSITFFSKTIFLLEGRSLTIPQYNSMRNPKLFDKILLYTLLSLLVFYAVFSCLVCLAFGIETPSGSFTEVLENLFLRDLSSLLISFSMLVSMLVFSLPFFQSLEFEIRNSYRKFQKLGLKPSRFKFVLKRLFIRVCVLSFCCTISFYFKDYINRIIAIIGSTFGVFLGFIAPAACHLSLFDSSEKEAFVLDYILIVFGIVFSIISLFVVFSQYY